MLHEEIQKAIRNIGKKSDKEKAAILPALLGLIAAGGTLTAVLAEATLKAPPMVNWTFLGGLIVASLAVTIFIIALFRHKVFNKGTDSLSDAYLRT